MVLKIIAFCFTRFRLRCTAWQGTDALLPQNLIAVARAAGRLNGNESCLRQQKDCSSLLFARHWVLC